MLRNKRARVCQSANVRALFAVLALAMGFIDIGAAAADEIAFIASRSHLDDNRKPRSGNPALPSSAPRHHPSAAHGRTRLRLRRWKCWTSSVQCCCRPRPIRDRESSTKQLAQRLDQRVTLIIATYGNAQILIDARQLEVTYENFSIL